MQHRLQACPRTAPGVAPGAHGDHGQLVEASAGPGEAHGRTASNGEKRSVCATTRAGLQGPLLSVISDWDVSVGMNPPWPAFSLSCAAHELGWRGPCQQTLISNVNAFPCLFFAPLGKDEDGQFTLASTSCDAASVGPLSRRRQTTSPFHFPRIRMPSSQTQRGIKHRRLARLTCSVH